MRNLYNIKKMFKYCKNLIDFEFDISNDKIEECPICFEDKKLKLFCDKHKMCNKCCKACIEQNNLCPICREMCSNPKYMKYNVQFSNLTFDTISILNLEIFFKHWHKPYCIKKKHKMRISANKKGKKLDVQCLNCNISQDFPLFTCFFDN